MSKLFCNTEDSGIYKIAKDVNLREYCGTEYKKLCVLYKDEEVCSDGIQKNVDGAKWIHVTGTMFKGDGFVNSKYLKKVTL